MKPLRFILFSALFLMQLLPLGATNYYVSNTGNNSNNGLSSENAFLTLQYAVGIVSAGDTVFVENGTYAGFDIRDTDGTSTTPIVFKALGNNVLISTSGPNRDDGINIENCDYIVIDGFISNNMPGSGNGIRIVTSDFCVIRNCRCDNNAERGIFTGFTDDILIEHNICSNSIDEHGIYVSNSSDRPIIRYNECYGNSGCGIHMNGDASMGEDGIIHDAQVYCNKIHDNKLAAGINMDGVVNSVIYNNLIYNNHNSQGIVLFQIDGGAMSRGAKIYNNTIIVPEDGRWGILLQDGANVDTEIYNNIIINQHSFRGCIGVWSTDQFVSDYNIVNNKLGDSGDDYTITLSEWQALGFDANSLLADDLSAIFENPISNNYHLKVASQAIDFGTDIVSSIVTEDIAGYIRPGGDAYDIGAYEYGSVLYATDVKDEIQIKISPNPATDYFNIRTEGAENTIEKIDLIDLNGKYLKSFDPEQAIDVRNIPNGLYFFRLQLKNNKEIRKKVVIF